MTGRDALERVLDFAEVPALRTTLRDARAYVAALEAERDALRGEAERLKVAWSHWQARAISADLQAEKYREALEGPIPSTEKQVMQSELDALRSRLAAAHPASEPKPMKPFICETCGYLRREICTKCFTPLASEPKLTIHPDSPAYESMGGASEPRAELDEAAWREAVNAILVRLVQIHPNDWSDIDLTPILPVVAAAKGEG